MEGTAVTAIADLARRAAGEETVVDIEGEAFSTVQLYRAPLEHQPDQPDTLVLHSLQGMVDYIDANRDQLVGAECLVHVASPTSVRVVSQLKERAARFTYVEAIATDLWTPKVDRHMSLLDTNIALQSLVTDAHDRAVVINLVGNVTEKAEVHVEDDGFTQKVGTRAGVHTVAESTVPNPITLAPFRTFREVEQPKSPFVLRIHRGNGDSPTVTFHEGDGGAWKLEAVERVTAWLTDKVGDFAIIR